MGSLTTDQQNILGMSSNIWQMNPIYKPPLTTYVSDDTLANFLPVLAYWAYSLVYCVIDYLQLPYFEKYRLHSSEETKRRNRATFRAVLKAVIFQQILQLLVGYILLHIEEPARILKDDLALGQTAIQYAWLMSFLNISVKTYDKYFVRTLFYFVIPGLKFFIAVAFLDGWQFFWHMYMHKNKYLYNKIHSWHHRLYAPFAFGALYNHPLEGLLLDTAGAGIAFKLTNLSVREGMVFFIFSTLKTVDDHCGYLIPWNPLQLVFSNNAKYHDIHHQSYGFQKNYSQPFFTFWDKVFGTTLSYEEAAALRKPKLEKQ